MGVAMMDDMVMVMVMVIAVEEEGGSKSSAV